MGPFTPSIGQLRYLIVSMEYFTKWIEAEALENFTIANVLKFFKRNILARLGVPQAIVTENGTQFIDKRLKCLLDN